MFQSKSWNYSIFFMNINLNIILLKTFSGGWSRASLHCIMYDTHLLLLVDEMLKNKLDCFPHSPENMHLPCTLQNTYSAGHRMKIDKEGLVTLGLLAAVARPSVCWKKVACSTDHFPLSMGRLFLFLYRLLWCSILKVK